MKSTSSRHNSCGNRLAQSRNTVLYLHITAWPVEVLCFIDCIPLMCSVTLKKMNVYYHMYFMFFNYNGCIFRDLLPSLTFYILYACFIKITINIIYHILQVGAAISMTYTTGQPIVFVGTGQTYTDLKNLNSKAVVNSLLKA